MRYLVSYYPLDEGPGSKVYDRSTGYYPNILWDSEAANIRTPALIPDSRNGPYWTADPKPFRWCKPFQHFINGICLNAEKFLYFTRGTSHSVSFPAMDKSTQDFTVEFWAYLEPGAVPAHAEVLLSRQPDFSTKITMHVLDSSLVAFRCYVGGDDPTAISDDGSSFLECTNIARTTVNKRWLHLSCANAYTNYSKSSLRLRFSDGTVLANEAAGFHMNVTAGTTMKIGEDGSAGFTGAIRELRVWNYFVSTGGVMFQSRSELRSLAYTSRLLSYWKLQESAGGILYDSTKASARVSFLSTPASDPQWTELDVTPKLYLTGPSERFEVSTSLRPSIYADKVMRVLSALSTEVTPKEFTIGYKGSLSEFTVKLWMKVTTLGAPFRIYKPNHFQIGVSLDTAVPKLLVTFLVGNGLNFQVGDSKYALTSTWTMVLLSVSSKKDVAFGYVNNALGTSVQSWDLRSSAFIPGTSTSDKVYFTYSNCDIFLRSLQIDRVFTSYSAPIFFYDPVYYLPTLI